MLETIKINDVKQELGKWVRMCRQQQNLTQEGLAEQLNVSRITIQNLEAGKNFTIDTLLKALRHFDLLPKVMAWVTEGQQEAQPPNNLY